MYGCSARLMPSVKRQGLLPKPLVQQLLPNFFVFIIESSIGVQCVVLLIACMLCIEVVGALVVRETRTQSVGHLLRSMWQCTDHHVQGRCVV